MTTATQTRKEAQLRFGETRLNDEHLERLLAERDEAKQAYEDAKGYLDDYLAMKSFIEGEYRVGPYRLAVKHKTTHTISIPKQ